MYIDLMHLKIQRVRVTDANLDYMDQDWMDKYHCLCVMDYKEARQHTPHVNLMKE